MGRSLCDIPRKVNEHSPAEREISIFRAPYVPGKAPLAGEGWLYRETIPENLRLKDGKGEDYAPEERDHVIKFTGLNDINTHTPVFEVDLEDGRRLLLTKAFGRVFIEDRPGASWYGTLFVCL